MKKTKVLILSALSALTVCSVVTFTCSNKRPIISSFAQKEYHVLTLNDSNKPTITGTNASLNLESEYSTFTYKSVKATIGSGNHIELDAGGSFYKNEESKDIATINVTFSDGDLSVYTGDSLTESGLCYFYELTSAQSVNVTGNYFKFVTTNGVKIQSVQITYDCFDGVEISHNYSQTVTRFDNDYHYFDCLDEHCISTNKAAHSIVELETKENGHRVIECENCNFTSEYDGIVVVTPPARTEYAIGETFVSNGLTVRRSLNGVPVGPEVQFEIDADSLLPLEIGNDQITINYTNSFEETYSTTFDISIEAGVAIEAEATEIFNGEIATTGEIAKYASNGALARNFKENGSMTFAIEADEEKTAKLFLVGSSLCVKEYDSVQTSLPIETSDMFINKMLSLTVNGNNVSIDDSCKFEGARFESASYKNFANWSNVLVANISLNEGLNIIKFTFKNNIYKNVNGTAASAYYDKIMLTGEGLTVAEVPAEQVDYLKWEVDAMAYTGAVPAGDTTVHPTYSYSGVSGNFSDKAFLKNFTSKATITQSFKLDEAKVGSVKVWASVTNTTSEVVANDIFDLYINNTKIVVDDSVKLLSGKAAWLVQAFDFGTQSFVKGTNTIELRFHTATEAIFMDYVDIDFVNVGDPNYFKWEVDQTEYSGAVPAGDTSVHPTYGSSGVAGNFSDKAFLKNFASNALISQSFELINAHNAIIKVWASVTNTTSEVVANDIFDLYINNTKIVVDDSVKLLSGKAAWLVQAFDFGTQSFVKGTNTIELRFHTATEAIFMDYIDVSILN